jgi:hypothetical protein
MIIFVIRRYNDIDHLCPIVYKLKKDTTRPVMVLCQNPDYNIFDDFRLEYLRDSLGVDIRYVPEAHTPTTLHRVLARLLCGRHRLYAEHKISPANAPLVLPARAFLKVLHTDFVNNHVFRRFFGVEWAVDFFNQAGVSAVVFDFAKTRQYHTDILFNAAKQLNIPTVAVPPGAMMYADKLGTIKSFEQYEFPDYDYYVMQHELRRSLTVAIGGRLDKMVNLGIPRFSSEWLEVLNHITPRSLSLEPPQNGKIRVLYIDRPIHDGMDKEKLVATLRGISKLDFVDLIIKPHTRNNRLHFQELSNLGRVVNDTDSLELIRWADAVVGTTSSILLEALLQDKTLLFPGYLCDHHMLIDQMNACHKVDNLETLLTTLRQIQAGKFSRSYSTKNVQALVTRLVYDGETDGDVLTNYQEFLKSIEKRA